MHLQKYFATDEYLSLVVFNVRYDFYKKKNCSNYLIVNYFMERTT